MTKGFNWIHAGGADGRQQSGDDTYDGKNAERDQHDGRGGAQEDVALVVCGFIDV